MKDKSVAILESRMRDHIASLVRKYGGAPFSAPALAEIPDVDPAHIDELIRDWNSAPPDVFIFQTGVGTRALFAATDLLGLTDILLRLLDSAQVVVRGPKPATVLHSRKARIDGAASDPFGAQLLATPLGAKEATAVLISLIAGIRSLCAHRGVPERRPSRRLSLETLRPRIHPSRACSR
jgi:uroporphyrinogen-III synthase